MRCLTASSGVRHTSGLSCTLKTGVYDTVSDTPAFAVSVSSNGPPHSPTYRGTPPIGGVGGSGKLDRGSTRLTVAGNLRGVSVGLGLFDERFPLVLV
jgi:hypothetical protein